MALVGAVLCWLGLRSVSPSRPVPAPVAEATTIEPVQAAPEPPTPAPAPVPAQPPVEPKVVQPSTNVANVQAPPPQAPDNNHIYNPETDLPKLRNTADGLDPLRTWGNTRELPREFGQHGDEFNTRSIFMYAGKAAYFYQEAPKHRFPTKVDESGVIRIYDPGSNTYGEYNPDGTTRRFLRPKEGRSFFDNQPGQAALSE